VRQQRRHQRRPRCRSVDLCKKSLAPRAPLLAGELAWMFAGIRRRSGSIYPAMASHAAFNLTMNVLIFAALWD
jgi:hypothetical protein